MVKKRSFKKIVEIGEIGALSITEFEPVGEIGA